MHKPLLRPGSIGNVALALVSAAGLAAFAMPFVLAIVHDSSARSARAVDASILLAFIVTGSMLVAVAELARGTSAGSISRAIALLGVLVAIDASLRLIPSFFGASPIFALIVLVGYVFGARFGFVMGALTLLLSAMITAGIGPWLPFQMLCAAWVGMCAGWLPRRSGDGSEVTTLIAFGIVAGFAYGGLMNLYSWPLAAPGITTDVGLYWTPALSLSETLRRYLAFYVATSVAHDASRAVATALLLLVAGTPVLRLLRRYESRARWSTTTAS